MHVLALEASTSSAKAMVYGLGRGSVKEVSVAYPPGVGAMATLDAKGVFECLMAAGAQAVREAAQPIDIVCLGTIWHSLLLVDDFGEPLTPVFTWANTDAAPDAAKIRRNEALCAELYARTGCMAHSLYPSMQLLRLKREQEGLFNRAAGYWSLSVYLLRRMTGETAYSKCAASGSGMMNIHTLRWDDDIIGLLGVDARKLPALCEPATALPITDAVAKRLGIQRVPCAAGGSDGALNQIGAGAMGDGVMTMSLGTSGALRVAVNEPVLPKKPSTWCYYIAGGKRIAGAATSGCCNCVDWFRALIGSPPFAELDAHLAADIDSVRDAPLFMPFMWGERCPGWQDARTGGFIGLKGEHGISPLYYAVQEGALFNLKQCYDIIVREVGVPREVRVSGGILKSEMFRRMAASAFGRPLNITSQLNASIFGGAALGLYAAGVLGDLAQFPAARGLPTEPDEALADLMAPRYERYLEAYDRYEASM